MFNKFKNQTNYMHALLNLIKDKWYILFYMLVNIGFVFSYTLKYQPILEYIFIGLILILGGFITFNYLENFSEVFDKLLEKEIYSILLINLLNLIGLSFFVKSYL